MVIVAKSILDCAETTAQHNLKLVSVSKLKNYGARAAYATVFCSEFFALNF